jgi:hypothetical protein
MASTLKISVAEDCPGCVEARAIAETIPQILNKFKADSFIEIGCKRIDILDPEGLELISAE